MMIDNIVNEQISGRIVFIDITSIVGEKRGVAIAKNSN